MSKPGYETFMGTTRLYTLRFSYQGNRACAGRKGLMGTIAQFFHFLAEDIIIQNLTHIMTPMAWARVIRPCP